jgi:hypothetical protein
MNQRLACYTLFDITQTGVLNRARPSTEQDYEEWLFKRNTQCNFDTILQAVSLRSQPEVINFPTKKLVHINDTEFGNVYKNQYKDFVNVWNFDFEVHHASVFQDEDDELGCLYKDIQSVPMIKCGTELPNLGSFLDTTKDYKNIYFVKY